MRVPGTSLSLAIGYLGGPGIKRSVGGSSSDHPGLRLLAPQEQGGGEGNGSRATLRRRWSHAQLGYGAGLPAAEGSEGGIDLEEATGARVCCSELGPRTPGLVPDSLTASTFPWPQFPLCIGVRGLSGDSAFQL